MTKIRGRKTILVRRKTSSSIAALISLRPVEAVWNKVNSFLDEFREKHGGARRRFVINEFRRIFDKRAPDSAPLGLLKSAVGRELQFQGFADHKSLHLLSPKFKESHAASVSLNVSKLSRADRAMMEIAAECDGIEGTAMNTRKGKSKVRKQSKKQEETFRGMKSKKTGETLQQRIDGLLAKNERLPKTKKMTDEKMFSIMKKEFSSSKNMENPSYITASRSLFNRGGRGASAEAPAKQSKRYEKDGSVAEGRAKKATATTKKKGKVKVKGKKKVIVIRKKKRAA